MRSKVNGFDAAGNARADGEVQAWVNGVEVYSRNNFTMSVSENPATFKWFLLQSYYGGPCVDIYKAPQDQSEYWDNLVIWTE